MLKYISLLSCLLLLLNKPSHAQQPSVYTFTLEEAINFARSNNYALQNAVLDEQSAQKKVNEITAMGLPQISGSGNIINNTQIPTQVLPNFLKPVLGSGPDFIEARFGNTYTSNLTLSVNQLLFDGTFFLGLKASKEFVNLSRLSKTRTRIETEVNVAKAYYMVLLLESNQQMMQSNLNTLSKSKAELEQLLKSGFVEKVDYERLSLQVSNLEIQKEKIDDQTRVARMVLKMQMGVNAADSIILSSKLEELTNKTTATVVEENLNYGNRVEYQLLQQQLKLNQLDRKRYLVGYAPSLFAFGSHQQNAFASEGNFGKLYDIWYPGTTIGLSLSVPIFDGLKKHAQTQQASISIKKTENDIKFFENVIQQQAFSAKTDFNRAKKQLLVQQNNYKLAEDIYNTAQLKYKNGVGSSLELTVAQTDLDNARTNMLATAFELFVAELELKKALGKIN
jgi:outer membrane protein